MMEIKKLVENIHYESEEKKLDKKDVVGVLRQALLVGVSAALAVIADKLGGLDLGPYTALIVPLIITAISTVQKWLASNKESEKDV